LSRSANRTVVLAKFIDCQGALCQSAMLGCILRTQLSWREPNMEAPPHQTREAWLNYVAYRMAPMFERLEAPLPTQLRIAIGFTSRGRRSRHIGECWDNQCSEDRHFEIFIRPDLSESKDLMPMQVAAILGHELVHAAVGVAAGHRKEFRRVARGIGLTGQMAATTAGPEFEKALRPILEEAGPLPHGRLQSTNGASSHSSHR